MTESGDRGTTGGEAGREGPPDLIGDALNLADKLQRKLVTAGVKRGVDVVTSAPAKGDVWEEAIRLEDPQQKPPLEEFADIVRRSAPEVAGHLGRAGLALADAVGSTWSVVERSLEQAREEAKPSAEDVRDRDGRAEGDASQQITQGGHEEREEDARFSGGGV